MKYTHSELVQQKMLVDERFSKIYINMPNKVAHIQRNGSIAVGAAASGVVLIFVFVAFDTFIYLLALHDFLRSYCNPFLSPSFIYSVGVCADLCWSIVCDNNTAIFRRGDAIECDSLQNDKSICVREQRVRARNYVRFILHKRRKGIRSVLYRYSRVQCVFMDCRVHLDSFPTLPFDAIGFEHRNSFNLLRSHCTFHNARKRGRKRK